ncbi:unnamed protein product [Ectocarpus sp. 12 AP-2014]
MVAPLQLLVFCPRIVHVSFPSGTTLFSYRDVSAYCIFASKLCLVLISWLCWLVDYVVQYFLPIGADERRLVVRNCEYCVNRGSKTIGGLKQPVQPVRVRRRNLREGTIYADAHHFRSLRG